MPVNGPHRYRSSTCEGQVASPNMYPRSKIASVWATRAEMGDNDDQQTLTQLDSYANMVVEGSHSSVFGHSGKSADVWPFSSDCSKLESVPIVDATMAYDCPYSMTTYILAVKNALHVPSMEHNLVPPFILREAGLVVNDVPKLHTKQDVLSNDTHCIWN